MAAAFQSARSAVSAAVEMQRAFGSEPWPPPLDVRVRMGINTGEAIERGGDYFGPAVIKAARLMSLVAGGRAVCSTATAELVQVHLDDDIQLLPVGTVHLKGLSRNESVFALAGLGLSEQGTPLEAVRVTLRAAPVAANRLIGRTVELAAVIDALDQHRLVTVTGMGGIGKTRLALAVVEAVAHRFADGVAWVELASAQDRDAAVYEIATATGVRPQVGEELFVTVLTALAAREMLLVLDNCEHLRADVASLVQQISARGAVATILATSRERLGGPTERVIPVGPLDVVDANAALALLVERLGTSVSASEHRGLESIVRQVDGIPLAIELAAARCSSLGITEVAARLQGELRLLADRNQPTERHRTLEQMIAWSYDTLAPAEQTILRRLSVFEPSPGTALDCLPQIGTIGALNYSARPREAADVARIALDLNAASMRLPTRVSLLGSEAMSLALAADPAALSVGREAVMYGERSGCPSTLGFALYSSALAHQLLGGDPVEVALAFDRASTLAESVGNHWLIGMCAGVNLPGAGSNDPTLQLAAAVDAMDHFLQSGWSTHAWTAGWTIPGALAGIGHVEQAATWLGACVVCGIPRLANVVLPDELEAALAGEGDPRLHDAISAGKQLTFADLRRLTDDAMRT